MNLTDDNLNVDVTPDGIMIEPQYVSFLRSQNYAIDDVKDIQAIEGSEDDHLVCKIQTHLYPMHDERLDVAQHRIWLPVCSCWAFRQNSADVTNGKLPIDSENCKHIKQAYKEEKAKADEQQDTLL